jgi:hypothetical protein
MIFKQFVHTSEVLSLFSYCGHNVVWALHIEWQCGWWLKALRKMCCELGAVPDQTHMSLHVVCFACAVPLVVAQRRVTNEPIILPLHRRCCLSSLNKKRDPQKEEGSVK